ncbi:uncharacterized protein LOC62_04G005301 [Vanrija pseudolonga]|uniref:F-box domain-containing protein n=1 Tax=Vanrija pseudolonga TaxID=143232 RepID=A0AAF1BL53_9TREE|nr:hypothetical protein LOC62_04G005301 [Vanrija pseudolonga]
MDHEAHPRVIDAILSHCSVPALVRFSATSRSFHDRINAVLFNHAVLERDPIFLRTADGYLLPMRPELVRVLDIPCITRESQKALPAFLEQFTAVHTVRRAGRARFLPPECLPSVRTTIDCRGADFTNIGRAPSRTRRYVFHHCAFRKESTELGWLPSRHIDECVLVCHAGGPAFGRVSLQENIKQILRMALGFWSQVGDRARVTIVGIEAVLDPPLPTELEDLFYIAGPLEGRGPSTCRTARYKDHARASFVTMAEWQRELAAKGREIEGQEWFCDGPECPRG